MITKTKLILVAMTLGTAYYAYSHHLLMSEGFTRVPDFQVTDQNGWTGSLSACAYRPIMLYFWGIGCPASDENLALMESLYSEYKNTQLCFLPVAVDMGGVSLPNYLAQHNISYPVYDYAHEGDSIPKRIWPGTFPHLYVIDRQGYLQWTGRPWEGNKNEVEKTITYALYDGSPEAAVPIEDPSLDDDFIPESRDHKIVAKLYYAIQKLLQEDDFDQLDQMADQLRSSKTRLPGGHFELESFYNQIAALTSGHNGFDQKQSADMLEKWAQTKPASITARVALGEFWANYAWRIRGGGYSNDLTEDQKTSFIDYLGRARKILEDADKLPAKCPEVYHGLQSVAMGQSWNRGEYEALFRKATAFEPDYYPYYIAKAAYLEPWWYGVPGEWERFARESAEATKAIMGMELYTRIVWYFTDYKGHYMQEGQPPIFQQASWKLVKQGFIDMLKHYPDSYRDLNGFARMACWAEDKKTAKAIFEKIGDHYDPDIWAEGLNDGRDGEVVYAHWRQWANTTTVMDRIAGLWNTQRGNIQ